MKNFRHDYCLSGLITFYVTELMMKVLLMVSTLLLFCSHTLWAGDRRLENIDDDIIQLCQQDPAQGECQALIRAYETKNSWLKPKDTPGTILHLFFQEYRYHHDQDYPTSGSQCPRVDLGKYGELIAFSGRGVGNNEYFSPSAYLLKENDYFFSECNNRDAWFVIETNTEGDKEIVFYPEKNQPRKFFNTPEGRTKIEILKKVMSDHYDNENHYSANYRLPNLPIESQVDVDVEDFKNIPREKAAGIIQKGRKFGVEDFARLKEIDEKLYDVQLQHYLLMKPYGYSSKTFSVDLSSLNKTTPTIAAELIEKFDLKLSLRELEFGIDPIILEALLKKIIDEKLFKSQSISDFLTVAVLKPEIRKKLEKLVKDLQAHEEKLAGEQRRMLELQRRQEEAQIRLEKEKKVDENNFNQFVDDLELPKESSDALRSTYTNSTTQELKFMTYLYRDKWEAPVLKRPLQSVLTFQNDVHAIDFENKVRLTQLKNYPYDKEVSKRRLKRDKVDFRDLHEIAKQTELSATQAKAYQGKSFSYHPRNFQSDKLENLCEKRFVKNLMTALESDEGKSLLKKIERPIEFNAKNSGLDQASLVVNERYGYKEGLRILRDPLRLQEPLGINVGFKFDGSFCYAPSTESVIRILKDIHQLEKKNQEIANHYQARLEVALSGVEEEKKSQRKLMKERRRNSEAIETMSDLISVDSKNLESADVNSRNGAIND